MKTLKYFCLCTVAFFLCGLALHAQESNALSVQKVNVCGTVLDKTYGEPVIGAAVMVDGTDVGTITDIDGKFQISIAPGTTLVFSSVGMKTIKMEGADGMVVVLEDDVNFLEEVVVTGYMAEKKADLTGAVAVVKMKDVADIPTGNVMQALQGRVAGMNITTDGTPGGGNTSTLVRGTTTINNSSPLYVIDGMPTRDNVGSIVASADIESIQVLKDASSAAIYGAQAANGVIIITTKRANKGEIRVNLDMSLTAQTFSTGIDLLNTRQWADCYWQAYQNGNNGNNPNSQLFGNGDAPVIADTYYSGNTLMKLADTDWVKEIYSTALLQNYNLSLSRGGENGSSSLSINYMDHDGMCRNTDYKSFNTRLSGDYHFLDNRLRIGENIAVTRWTRHNNPGGIEEQIFKLMPMVPVYAEDGSYGGGYVDVLNDSPNPIRLTNNEADNKHIYWRVFGNAYIEVEPIKNLVLRSNFGVNYYNEENSVFTPKWQEGSRNVATNELDVSNAQQFNWIWTNQIQYSIDFGKNSLTALLGMEAKKERYDFFHGYGTGLEYEDLDYRYLDAVTSGKNVGGTASVYSMVSYFAKANYSYDGRYLASVTVRRDASSRFGKNNNSGYFPSVSLGWRLSREKFLSSAKSWLDDLKLRAAWGINGNDMIDNSATYSLFRNDVNNGGYNIIGDNQNLVAGTIRTHSGNPFLRWEQTMQTNVGLDATFLSSRLLLEADFFDKKTKDMLYEPAYAAVLGEGGYSFQNVAAMSNRGFEFTLTWRDSIKEFSYDISFNGSFNRNRITELPEQVYYTWGCGNGDNISNVGQPLGSWLGYKTDGIFHSQAEVDEYKGKYEIQYGNPGVGRLKYVDTNNDGIINAKDRVVLGSDQPKFIGGLNLSASWKGFDLSLFFNGMVRKAWNNSKFYTDLWAYWSGNHSTRLLEAYDSWKTFEKTGRYPSSIPALTTDGSNNENQSSDFFVENGSYLKLKTLTLGYTLPGKVLSKCRLRNLRVFVQSQNLFTITSYTGADPEGLGYTYPLPRTFTFGLSVGL
ncbi:MAG: SusC/RagA family TonB-linked outer membrane protein [Candidatus Cryptobacteroides sp.]